MSSTTTANMSTTTDKRVGILENIRQVLDKRPTRKRGLTRPEFFDAFKKITTNRAVGDFNALRALIVSVLAGRKPSSYDLRFCEGYGDEFAYAEGELIDAEELKTAFTGLGVRASVKRKGSDTQTVKTMKYSITTALFVYGELFDGILGPGNRASFTKRMFKCVVNTSQLIETYYCMHHRLTHCLDEFGNVVEVTYQQHKTDVGRFRVGSVKLIYKDTQRVATDKEFCEMAKEYFNRVIENPPTQMVGYDRIVW